MKMLWRSVSFLLIFLFSLPVCAGYTLVLVHGYLSNGVTWRSAGIVRHLQRTGWQDAGHLLPNGPFLPRRIVPSSNKRYIYTVTLPSEALLSTQAQWLDFYLRHLRVQHPNNKLVLVGHSVGGVVARLVTVTGKFPVRALVTIASPHLGTDKAEWGRLLSDSPAGLVAPFLGLNTINRSRGLYWDLAREHPTSLLFWLNRQPHPQALYISVVRIGDEWVPPYSQDMNDVPALHGLVTTVTSGGTHSLNPADGPLLASLLIRLLP